MRMSSLRIAGAALGLTLAVTLAGCGSEKAEPKAGGTAAPKAHPTLASATQGDLALSGGWAVATQAATESATKGKAPAANTEHDAAHKDAHGSEHQDDAGHDDMAHGDRHGDHAADAGTMSAAYAVIKNTGSTDDALVSVRTAAAGTSELHLTETKADGSSGTMKQVAEVAVPAGGAATLKPGGHHVMLMQLHGPLVAGTTIEMEWTFRSGLTLRTTLPVIDRKNRPTS